MVGGFWGWLWGLGFFVFAMFFAWLGITMSALVRQRNEARTKLKKLSQTPLTVECSSCGYSLAGGNEFGENRYIWTLDATLTNTSDKEKIGTKEVSLLVNFLVNEKVIHYDLNIIRQSELDKYEVSTSRKKGRLITEKEYLEPRQSLTGFYKFLDLNFIRFEGHSIKSKWPTLIVVDSLDQTHRRDFSKAPVGQPIFGKEGSRMR